MSSMSIIHDCAVYIWCILEDHHHKQCQGPHPIVHKLVNNGTNVRALQPWDGSCLPCVLSEFGPNKGPLPCATSIAIKLSSQVNGKIYVRGHLTLGLGSRSFMCI